MNALTDYKVVRFNSAVFPVIEEEKKALEDVNAKLVEAPGDDIAMKDYDAHAIIVASAKISGQLIEQMPNLLSITKLGVGTEKIDVETASKKGVLVMNVPDFCNSELADHTMALLLASARKLLPLDKGTRNSDWKIRDKVGLRRISGKNLGILGFGNLARNFVIRAKTLGVKVSAYDPYVDSKVMSGFGVKKMDRLENLLRESDFIVLLLPLTKETHHLIDIKEFKMMKKDAILINVARGAIVNEDALFKALKEKWIDAAAIDVYEKLEPFEEIPTKQYSPLFALDNIILTPHLASCSTESLKEVKERAAKETARVLSGKWPENLVNSKVSPRKRLK